MLLLPTRTRFLEFVLLPSFERTTEGLLSDEDVRELECELLEDPRRGRVMRGTGGVRKRSARPSRGAASAAARA